MRKRLSLLLLLAMMAVVRASAFSGTVCNQFISSSITSSDAKPYDDSLGDYKIWLTSETELFVTVYTLHLYNVLIDLTDAGVTAVDISLSKDEAFKVKVESESKIKSSKCAISVKDNNIPTTTMTIEGSSPLILESTGAHALAMSNFYETCILNIDAPLQVTNTTSPAEDKKAAIWALPSTKNELHVSPVGRLKAKSNYAGIMGFSTIDLDPDVTKNFDVAEISTDCYGSVDTGTTSLKTDWCYINNYDLPLKIAGTQVTYADIWGENSEIESPYITKGSVTCGFDSGFLNVNLGGALIDIPAEVTDVPGIWCYGDKVKLVLYENKNTENGHITRINVPGGDGIRIDGKCESAIITQIEEAYSYYRYLQLEAKTGINIKNETGMPFSAYIEKRINIQTKGETGIKVTGNEAADIYYQGDEGSEIKINSTGAAIILENEVAGNTQALFAGDGKLTIVSDGDGISLRDATVKFGGNVSGSIEARGGAAINGNKTVTYVRKESAESTMRLRGSEGAINNVYGLIIAAGAGELVQEENADDATMEKYNSETFWTYVQNGKPYTNWAALRYVEKYFQVGDYVLDDHNFGYFDKLVPGVSYDRSENYIHLDNAHIEAMGDNVGLKALTDKDVAVRLTGDNVIEANGTALENELGNLTITSPDGKGKLTLRAINGKGIHLKDAFYLHISDCTLDVTAYQEAVLNEKSSMTLKDCTASFRGNGGGYIGEQNSSQLSLERSAVTFEGQENPSFSPSCRGYNLSLGLTEELLTEGYSVVVSGGEFYVAKTAGGTTGETIQFGVKPENLEYYIHISGTMVNAANCQDIKPSDPTELSSGKISYDPTERTLTLDNITLSGGTILITNESKCEKILLVGNNTVTEAGPLGIFFGNSVPVTIMSEDRTGTLNFSATTTCSTAFDLQADLTLKDCNLNIKVDNGRALWGNNYRLTVDEANASFFGESGSVQHLSGIDYDPYPTETSMTAPANATFNYSTGNVEVDGIPVQNEAVVFHYSKQYNLWIGTEQVTADNCADIKTSALTSGKVSFDPETNVLTFDQAVLKAYFSSLIDEPITIKLNGKNKIMGDSWSYISRAATITSDDGKGSLDINSTGMGLSTSGDLTVENCKLTIDAMYSGLSLYESTLTVNDATVIVEGSPSMEMGNLVLGEGLDITAPDGALFSITKGGVVINDELTNEEVTISKPAVPETSVAVTVGTAGAAGFSYHKAVDFTGVKNISAWIATGFRKGNIMLSRVNKVPAGVGVYLKGEKGKELKANVPIVSDDSYYANMFVGVPAGKNVAEKESNGVTDFNTFSFARSKSTGAPTFYPIPSEGKSVDAGKMYLRIRDDVDVNDVSGSTTSETVSVTVSDAGAAGFSSYDKGLDFTDVKDISAWICTGFSGGNIQLSRVYAVPAGTGVYLKGKKGEFITRQVPVSTEKPYYKNLFRATGATATTIFRYDYDDEEGFKVRTLYFATSLSTGAPTFFPTDDSGKDLAANKMFLCLPSGLVPSLARGFNLEFLDEDAEVGTTGIIDMTADDSQQDGMGSNALYNLSGQRVLTPARGGLYIQNGRKVVRK